MANTISIEKGALPESMLLISYCLINNPSVQLAIFDMFKIQRDEEGLECTVSKCKQEFLDLPKRNH